MCALLVLGLVFSYKAKRLAWYERYGMVCMTFHKPTDWLGKRLWNNLFCFQEINSFGWYNDTMKNSSITTKHLYFILTFRSHHEIFIRRSWYSVLPSLDATISCRIKKAVVGVTQLITALVSIHSSMTFLADMYSWVTPTTAFLMWQLIVALRLGRTEYQLILMKISWWDRNVKIRYKCLIVIDEFLTVTCFVSSGT